ncbi:tyrosine-type recombinase/integrase [Microbacterium karelineae]|uniref:tyrosine-type recombinase/integrase n=1 Tax=Microbacterium karelineae TaxID=2654283 RepID=UPI0012E9EDA2|nr:tyrosine-type recombinase/integrase [Microbacterium karelineae]
MSAYRETLLAAGRSTATIAQRVGDVERFGRTVDLRSCTVDDVTAYFATHPAWSAEYRKKIAISLRLFFAWAQKRNLLVHHPEAGIPRVRVPRTARPPAPDDEIERALAMATPRERAAILLGASLGMRRAEITAAHPQHRRGRVLTVTGKGGRTRHLPLDDETYRALVALESGQGRDVPYFPGGSADGHVHPCTIYKWVTAILPGWSPHSLRRRAGREGFRRTKNIRAVQTFLGHESLDTTALYVHVDQDEVAAVTEATSFGRTARAASIDDATMDVAAVLAEITAVTDRAAAVGLNVKLTVT